MNRIEELQHFDFQLRVLENISHDIRTNLNEIQGYLSFLEQRELREEELTHLLRARKAAHSLRYSVDKILNFSSLNAAELQLDREWFSLDDLIVDVAERASKEASSKGLRFLLDIQTGTGTVYGDARRLKEMLSYLLENAVKFTPKGYVMLRLRREQTAEGEAIDLVVQDSGIGMSPAEVRQACEPYSRFVDSEKGVGLGLYFSRMISEKMGAVLEIQSMPNEGTTVRFQVTLPRAEENEAVSEVLQGKRAVVFCDGRLEVNREILDLQREIFELRGLRIDFFEEEESFIQELIGSEEIPELVSVATVPEHYVNFGMLFAFLRKSRSYGKTLFVAERMGNHLLPEHFDEGFEGHAGVQGYLEVLGREPAVSESKGLKILLVDDLETNLEILRLYLSKMAPNAEIDTALGGYEAIGMYKTRRYDLILLDLKMPGLDGFQLLERFMDIRPIPIVYAVTAEVYESTRQEVEASGFKGLLEKPFNPGALNKVIKEASNAEDH